MHTVYNDPEFVREAAALSQLLPSRLLLLPLVRVSDLTPGTSNDAGVANEGYHSSEYPCCTRESRSLDGLTARIDTLSMNVRTSCMRCAGLRSCARSRKSATSDAERATICGPPTARHGSKRLLRPGTRTHSGAVAGASAGVHACATAASLARAAPGCAWTDRIGIHA
jgi:hypothetical protein